MLTALWLARATMLLWVGLLVNGLLAWGTVAFLYLPGLAAAASCAEFWRRRLER